MSSFSKSVLSLLVKNVLVLLQLDTHAHTHTHTPTHTHTQTHTVFPPPAAADLWVMKRSSGYETRWWERLERSDVFVVGLSLSWCSRCFCEICSIAFTPVLPVGASAWEACVDCISFSSKNILETDKHELKFTINYLKYAVCCVHLFCWFSVYYRLNSFKFIIILNAWKASYEHDRYLSVVWDICSWHWPAGGSVRCQIATDSHWQGSCKGGQFSEFKIMHRSGNSPIQVYFSATLGLMGNFF